MTLVVAAIAVILAVVAAQIMTAVHGHLPPGGYALLGLVTGIALAGVAKALATLGLQRPLPERRGD